MSRPIAWEPGEPSQKVTWDAIEGAFQFISMPQKPRLDPAVLLRDLLVRFGPADPNGPAMTYCEAPRSVQPVIYLEPWEPRSWLERREELDREWLAVAGRYAPPPPDSVEPTPDEWPTGLTPGLPLPIPLQF